MQMAIRPQPRLRSVSCVSYFEPPLTDIAKLCLLCPMFHTDRVGAAHAGVINPEGGYTSHFGITKRGDRLVLKYAKNFTVAATEFRAMEKYLTERLGVKLVEARVYNTMGTFKMPSRIRINQAYRELRRRGAKVHRHTVKGHRYLTIGNPGDANYAKVSWKGHVFCSEGNPKSKGVFDEHTQEVIDLLMPFIEQK